MSRAPNQLGRYQLLGQLASGGMADVYIARLTGSAPGFDKQVAVKILNPAHYGTPDALEMFHDEARLTARIAHANVCSTLDFGQADGIAYLVLELLDGVTFGALGRASHRGPDPLRAHRIARVIADAATGLHAAHELRDPDGAHLLNVVHRDVTPGNVFLTRSGTVKVMDFGIARARDQVHRTTTGTVKGTVGYMSPEQLAGVRVDRRSDIWSLGCLAWEGIAGRPLFARGDLVDTVSMIRDEAIPSLRSMNPSTPEELDRLIAKAVSRSPDDRFQTARSFARALVEWLIDQRTIISSDDLAEWFAELGVSARSPTPMIADPQTLPSGS